MLCGILTTAPVSLQLYTADDDDYDAENSEQHREPRTDVVQHRVARWRHFANIAYKNSSYTYDTEYFYHTRAITLYCTYLHQIISNYK